MNDKSCGPIVELLVEYADGELPPDEARRVADHLAGCPDCRAELRLLERSLEVAREVWQESCLQKGDRTLLCAAPFGPFRQKGPVPFLLRVAACVVACAVVLLLAAGPWLFWRGRPHSEVNVPEEVGQRVPQQPVEEIDIEALIAREGRSARLAAAARLLATQPGLQEYAQQAERYLQETYRGTAAVNGALPPPPSEKNKEPKS